MEEIIIINKGEPYEILQVKQKWATWEISQDSDGDIEISCDPIIMGCSRLYLNQEQLKLTIEFLQSKIK
jgi:hypothetical protein